MLSFYLDARVDVANDGLESHQFREKGQILEQYLFIFLQLLRAHHDLLLFLLHNQLFTNCNVGHFLPFLHLMSHPFFE